ncbi:MAG: ketol-acid reductoisomerase [Myxococcales bacterium]|nr:ketol-acid reductoisomerase [Myxococcales bacterium]
MTRYFNEKDVNPQALKAQKITVVGYGSQGRAHALSLRDSGLAVTVALRPGGKSWATATQDGFKPQEVAGAVREADVVMVLVPDMNQPKLFQDVLNENLRDGVLLLFAHGFAVHYNRVALSEKWDVGLVAPKGPGNLVRQQYEQGRGVPCLLAVHQDHSGNAFERTLAYAHGIGGTRAGVLETTFKEETETDLFGEQAVLCGGTTALLTAGWETLVEAGYSPELAYFECLHELKLIVDLLYEGGLSRMHHFVSDTASYGDLTRGTRVVDNATKARMRVLLEEIQSGEFAREWSTEHDQGSPNYAAALENMREHPIEKVGAQLRERMAWLQ